MNNLLKALIAALVLAAIAIGAIVIMESGTEGPNISDETQATIPDPAPEPEIPDLPRNPIDQSRTVNISGTVRDDGGAPMKRARVIAFVYEKGSSGAVASRSGSTRTDSSGAFLLTDLRPGVYRFEARARGELVHSRS